MSEMEELEKYSGRHFKPIKCCMDLPDPPKTSRDILKMIGPAAIITAAGIGAGELLTGPVAAIQYGLMLMWIVTLGIIHQTVLNGEAARYAVATGETIWQGMARLTPGPKFWGVVWTILFFVQNFWPGWASATATGVAYAVLGHVPTAKESWLVITIGIVLFLLSVFLVCLGRKVERTLEIISFGEIIFSLILFGLAIFMVSPKIWQEMLVGAVSFGSIPKGVDWTLIAAFAGYVGSSGTVALLASNYYRDRGYGMGAHTGYIPGLIGGKPLKISETGYYPKLDEENKARFRGWMRLVNLDQGVIFGIMNYIGMAAPVAIAVSIVPPGTKIGGWGIVGQFADHAKALGPWGPALILITWCWLLWTTQLSSIERIPRFLTDYSVSIGPERLKKVGDVRKLYYSYLAIFSILAIIAMTQLQPLVLVILGAVTSSFNFCLGSLLVLIVNRKLLPKELRPPLWRQVIIVIGFLFYGFLSAEVALSYLPK